MGKKLSKNEVKLALQQFFHSPSIFDPEFFCFHQTTITRVRFSLDKESKTSRKLPTKAKKCTFSPLGWMDCSTFITSNGQNLFIVVLESCFCSKKRFFRVLSRHCPRKAKALFLPQGKKSLKSMKFSAFFLFNFNEFKTFQRNLNHKRVFGFA